RVTELVKETLYKTLHKAGVGRGVGQDGEQGQHDGEQGQHDGDRHAAGVVHGVADAVGADHGPMPNVIAVTKVELLIARDLTWVDCCGCTSAASRRGCCTAG